MLRACVTLIDDQRLRDRRDIIDDVQLSGSISFKRIEGGAGLARLPNGSST